MTPRAQRTSKLRPMYSPLVWLSTVGLGFEEEFLYPAVSETVLHRIVHSSWISGNLVLGRKNF